MKTQYQIGLNLSLRHHAGQFRRDGVTPYVTHLARVVLRLNSESDEVKAVGILHDILEDTPCTPQDLSDAGICDNVIRAVQLLTKTEHGAYENYIHRIMENEIAKKVKVADMLDNISDFPTPPNKQILKYAKGLQILLS